MIKKFKNDICVITQKRRIWYYLSISDVKSRFRRSKFGLAWLVFQQLAFSLGAGLIWATVFGLKPSEFIPFLTVGFAIWGFISGIAMEGCMTFIVAGGYLKQMPLPQQIFIARTMFTQFLYFSVGLLTAILILVLFGSFQLMNVLLSFPGLVILFGYGYFTTNLFSYLGVRYRDLAHALSSLFNLLFVVTPVIYPSEVLISKGLHIVVFGNPFASLIEIIRLPLVDGELPYIGHYMVALCFVFLISVLSSLVSSKWERMVAYWS